jgi:beta-lactamase superfamily II metal-dependent hydrolase
MADELLIRAYNVGCGDCIYVRIPGPDDDFHILIDCGTKSGDAQLKTAIRHLKGELPLVSAGSEKRRLDLLVATHRHEDHIKGFDPREFEDVHVRNIWLSAGMNPEHPQAQGVNALHEYSALAMQALMDSGQALGPEVELLASMYGVNNTTADRLLMKTLPAASGIEARYVHSGMPHELDLPPGTNIHILAPEEDIDGFYLGEEPDPTLARLKGFSDGTAPAVRPVSTGDAATAPAPASPAPASPPAATAASPAMPAPPAMPANISATDFRVLQSRMLSNALAFAAKDTSIQNNLSVCLLIEWKKRRLLFVGDAEWEGEYRKGKHNGSWNVMWEKHRDTHLKSPIDFLKVGHHGSINATPPAPESRPPSKKVVEGGVYAILDTILPVPQNGDTSTAQAIVSTEREFYPPIPEGKVLVDLARRIDRTSACCYGELLDANDVDRKTIWTSTKAKKERFLEDYEQEFLDARQPLRTDLEMVARRKPFVDITFTPSE